MRRLVRWHDTSNLSLERSGQLNFDAQEISKLSARLVGSVTLPQDVDYSASRETFMAAFQHFPQIIVHCRGVADIVESVKFARRTGLQPVCRSGGHSTAGYSVNDEMVIDVGDIHYCLVDTASRIAWVGAGAHFAQVNAALELYGMHIPSGGCETVGVAGYMQGGGYSFTSQMFGMNCDCVRAVRLVMADGSLVTASADENPNLFWAVRGGTGNNFGVVYEIEYDLCALGELWGFGYKWPLTTAEQAAEAAVAMSRWQEHFTGDHVPENLGNQALLVYTQEAGDLKPAPYFIIRGMYNGSAGQCRHALAPLLELMPDEEKYRDIWHRGTYRQLNEYLLSHPTELPANVPNSARALAKSHIIARNLSAKEWRTVIDLYRDTPNADNFIGLEAYGGAINRVAPEATAFWHRRASLDAFVFSFWLREKTRDDAEVFVQEFDRIMKPLCNGHSYQNYPNRSNEDFGNMYFGGNLARLLQVKQQYDPENFFTFPQGLGVIAGADAVGRAAGAS